VSRACMQGGSQIAVEHALIVCKCLCAHVWLQVSCRWEEGRFTVSKAAGIQERKKREQETIDKAMSKAKPGAWGCVQVCDPTNLGLLWRVRVMMFLMSIIHVICV
jgi:hypothetical protein